MSPRVNHLAALGGFLDGTSYNGAALQACVRGMVDALTYETRNPAEARRIILDAIPLDRRAIVAAMLPKRPAHRPKSPATAVKDIELLTFYDLAKVRHPKWSDRKIAQEYTLRHRGEPCANEDAIRAAIQRLRQAEKRSRHLMR